MKTLRLGDMEVSKITESNGPPLPLTFAYPAVTDEQVAQTRLWFADEHLLPDRNVAQISLSTQSFIIRVGKRIVLVDACCGNDKERAVPFASRLATDYLAQLSRLGLTPGDIDAVLCTHLHFDHVGWNTRLADGGWVPTFPNAQYYFTREDYEFFSAHRDDPFHGPAFVDSVLPIVAAGQARLVETDHRIEHELDHGLWLEGTPGHSVGSCVVHAESAGRQALFSGDLFHHPLQLTHPSLVMMADHDPTLAIRSRHRILEAHADRDTVFFPAHFPDPTAGRVVSHGAGFRYAFLAE